MPTGRIGGPLCRPRLDHRPARGVGAVLADRCLQWRAVSRRGAMGGLDLICPAQERRLCGLADIDDLPGRTEDHLINRADPLPKGWRRPETAGAGRCTGR